MFHAPLIAATDRLDVTTIVTSDAARARQAAAEHPEAQVVPRVEDLWTATSPELVVVATANQTHVPIALAAIEHGVPVVVEKPAAVTSDDAETLVEQTDRAGVLLTVFQNRRWDTDQLTLRRLIDENALGEVTRYESRFERWRPNLDPAKPRENLSPTEGGGVLLDLGVHLVDQAMVLFGPVHRGLRGDRLTPRGARRGRRVRRPAPFERDDQPPARLRRHAVCRSAAARTGNQRWVPRPPSRSTGSGTA